ncbi:MAG: hypothetical protein SH856_04905 [Flavobacteriales bacterium]|mgnify:CR=1 FL=1|nr:hypothetical protein [Flavobacteriales bacterium]
MKIFKYLLLIATALPLATFAQCRSFTKSNCLPVLQGYVQNDNYNSAVLVPGDEAELLLTFYAGKDYRIVVCAQPRIGDVDYEITDTNQELIHRGNTRDTNIFDFRMATTQQLIVRIQVPELTHETAIVPDGCVAVMVGYKQE